MALSQWHIIGLGSFCAIATLLIVRLLLKRSRQIRAQAALSTTSDKRYLLALAGSTDGFWDWDLLSDTVFYSDRFREILGLNRSTLRARIKKLGIHQP